MRWDEKTEPRLKIFDTCKHTIRTIPAVIYNKNGGGDVDTDCEDHICVTKDTQVYTVEGLKAIGDLVGTTGYCYGWSGNRIGATQFYNVTKTREQAEVWELGLDDGSILKATPDHRIMLRDGSYKKLKDLEVGESLMPIYSCVDHHGHLNINLNNDRKRWSAQKMVYNDIVAPIENSWTNNVHHIDFNKLNNNPDNLQLMTRAEHCRLHAINRKSPSEQTRIKMSESHARKFLSEEYKKHNKAHLDNIRSLSKIWHSSEQGKQWHSEHAKQIAINKHQSDNYFEKECPVCHNMFQTKDNRRKYCNNNCKATAIRRKKQGLPIDSIVIGFKKQYEPIYSNYNHKVKYIKFYGYEDVYDMTTGFGNFATDKIIIHNCDELRYFIQTVRDNRTPKSTNKLQTYLDNKHKSDKQFNFDY